MGNCVGKEEEVIVQPQFLGDMPDPWPIPEIYPELIVFRKDRPKLEISHDMTGEEAVDLLDRNDLLAKSRVIFITHGFRTDKNKEWLHLMKDRMIEERDQTVVIVGWGKGADIGLLNYEQASANCLAVGKWLSTHLIAIRNRSADINIWGLGHSLGAHLMGKAGRQSGVMNRITGLDAAGVGFQVENYDKRLCKSDAELVDVIHTDGMSVPYFGTLVPLGTIDFYPNFGWSQPTYDKPDQKPYMVTQKAEPKGPLSKYGSGFTISHTRALEYFIWSIDNRDKFRTKLILEGAPDVVTAVHRVKCVAVETEMGYFADQHENNVGTDSHYYVMTNANEPWA